MTSPDHPQPSNREARDDDKVDDPTGVHRLLSSLPEPGPMPDDLVARINASLQDAAEERGRTDPDVSYALFAGRNRRSRRTAWVRAAAVAAGVVVVGGGVLAGTGTITPVSLGMLGGPATSNVGSTGPTATGSTGTAPAGIASAAPQAGSRTVYLSRTPYTSNNLREKARALRASPPMPIADLAAEAPHLGPIATPQGLASCLSALGVSPDAEVLVDLSTYDGRPSAVIVTRQGDRVEVRVAKRTCTTGNPDLTTGPYPL